MLNIYIYICADVYVKLMVDVTAKGQMSYRVQNL